LKATVVGRDPLNINGYLHIDKGTEHAISINQPVISIDGLVGRVKHAGPTSSIVETVENKGFAASAIDVNTSIHGIIRKQRSLMFDYIRRTDSISVGDSIRTSGMSELFPKGILIGTVQRVSESDDLFFLRVYVAPATQINRLVSVYIILDGHEASTSSNR
jgi:rod shape-determining protein MreC